MKQFLDVAYGSDEKQKLDIYLPDAEAFPVFLYLHYGGFTGGDKGNAVYQPFIQHLTSRGIGVVSINFRLYPQAKYPDFLEDAAQAVAWAFEHLKEYGNVGKIYLGGSSSGGYASMMLCFDCSWLGKHGISPLDLAGFVHDSGQPTTHFNVLKERGMDTKRVVIDESAPIYHVGVDEVYPRMLIIVAEQDRRNRNEQNALLLSTLRHFGHEEDKVGFLVMPGKHVSYVGRLDDNGESEFGKAIFDFISAGE